jgi:DNA-binding NarL/FixJ family response regulator
MTRSDDVPDPTTLLILEDNKFFRASLVRELSLFPNDVKVVDSTDNVSSAREMLRELRPRLMLHDLRVRQYEGDRNPQTIYGLLAIREFLHLSPTTRILVFSALSRDDPAAVITALELGAHGYIDKDEEYDGETLIAMIGSIMRGEPVFTPVPAQVMLRLEPASTYTENQRTVLAGISVGRNLEQIAEDYKAPNSQIVSIMEEILTLFHQRGKLRDAGYITSRFADVP